MTERWRLAQCHKLERHGASREAKPVIKFKDGKAIKASINWSGIQESAVAKGALWPIGTLDNIKSRIGGCAPIASAVPQAPDHLSAS
jgi:hypothetical protein